ncbi:hypothetical protein [Marinobacterium sp. xm-d-530]|uniref:hypothetical protein n=1 Tax=Marinobacterium sp. xm-d-530 TaxID=2497747 RepID=UPI0015682CDE|nr:hypothetical protein [Marinobacterium sp. xm-d-530]NRQ01164.1 hypothetical protein [Marinobacterium sp. xm-d-530]
MAKFELDGKEYNTDDFDDRQKRIVALYQKSLRDENVALMELELKRAARIEVARKLIEEIAEK